MERIQLCSRNSTIHTYNCLHCTIFGRAASRPNYFHASSGRRVQQHEEIAVPRGVSLRQRSVQSATGMAGWRPAGCGVFDLEMDGMRSRESPAWLNARKWRRQNGRCSVTRRRESKPVNFSDALYPDFPPTGILKPVSAYRPAIEWGIVDLWTNDERSLQSKLRFVYSAQGKFYIWYPDWR